MKGRILLVVGLGIGYVLGARAGRQRYEQLKSAVQKFWNDPRVQQRVDDAEDFVKDKAPEVAEFLADSAKKVVGAVSGAKDGGARDEPKAPARKPAAKSGGSTAKK